MQGSSILITGGTGTFGRAFVRHVKQFAPSRIAVLSRDELKQHEMRLDFPEAEFPELRFFLGDVRDIERLRRAFRGVDYVVHAAALKQIVAAEYNPTECLRTNVDGSHNVIDAAIDCGVKKVIALSTDKAVHPVNLYGASKMCAEKLFVAANHLSGSDGCRFSVVRYGNIIGSRGSVVPLFKRLAAEGKPLPLTDERMTRFWMRISEACELVAWSLQKCRGGEIVIPSLCSASMLDLAKAFSDDIKPAGIRPGEKLHEELVSQPERSRLIRIDNWRWLIEPENPQWNYQSWGPSETLESYPADSFSAPRLSRQEIQESAA